MFFYLKICLFKQLPTIKEDNLTSTIPMMKNLTLLDVELNSSTGGVISQF